VVDGDNLDGITQKDLANKLQISQKQLGEYKKLTTLIPELQQMVENGAMNFQMRSSAVASGVS